MFVLQIHSRNDPTLYMSQEVWDVTEVSVLWFTLTIDCFFRLFFLWLEYFINKSNQKEYCCLFVDNLTILKTFKLMCYDFMFFFSVSEFVNHNLFEVKLESICNTASGFLLGTKPSYVLQEAAFFFYISNKLLVFMYHMLHVFTGEYIFFL
jgi:hypothetical protein